jgi:protein-glutamine gamma-glutamyltransferase
MLDYQQTYGGEPFPVPGVVQFAQRTLTQLKIADLPDEASMQADPDVRWQRNRRVARALAEWLQGGSFQYTTDLSAFVHVADEDPIESFLTRYQFGHCEHFASALVAMCQSLGIESRVVTGFIALEYDDATRQYVVRESNAHAWAEVRVGKYSWMTVDPTPQGELVALQDRNRSWADRWRWMWDQLEFLWNSQVVLFDSSTQATLADRFGSSWQHTAKDWGTQLATTAREVNNYFQLGPAGYLWLGLVAFAGILAVLSVISVRRRKQRLRAVTGVKERDRAAQQVLRQTGFWLDALDMLARHDQRKPDARVPRQHVDVLRIRNATAADCFEAIVDSYYQVRFAGQPLDSDSRAQVKAKIAELGQALSRAPS